MATYSQKIVLAKNGIQLLIRSAQESDAQEILKLSRSVMAESILNLTSEEELSLTLEREVEWIKQHLENSSQIILVAEYKNSLVGIIDFASDSGRRVKHQGDFGVSVIKEWRDQGVGSLLLSSLLEWASKNPDIEKVNLRVNSNNAPALKLYKKFGFVQEGLQKRDLKLGPNLYVDTILMGCFVKPEVREKEKHFSELYA